MQDSLGPDSRTIANRTIRKTLLRYGLFNFGVNFVMLVLMDKGNEGLFLGCEIQGGSRF